MSDRRMDFQGLGEALTGSESVQSGSLRGDLRKRFRAELADLLVGMRMAGIIGRNERPGDPAENCDICGSQLKEARLYVDGKIDHAGGMWGNMCLSCFREQGSGIGWGVGQLYRYDGFGWQCIGGGNPEPLEDEEI